MLTRTVERKVDGESRDAVTLQRSWPRLRTEPNAFAFACLFSGMKTNDPPHDRHRGVSRNTRWFVIGFAVVEAILIGWALLSGRLG